MENVSSKFTQFIHTNGYCIERCICENIPRDTFCIFIDDLFRQWMWMSRVFFLYSLSLSFSHFSWFYFFFLFLFSFGWFHLYFSVLIAIFHIFHTIPDADTDLLHANGSHRSLAFFIMNKMPINHEQGMKYDFFFFWFYFSEITITDESGTRNKKKNQYREYSILLQSKHLFIYDFNCSFTSFSCEIFSIAIDRCSFGFQSSGFYTFWYSKFWIFIRKTSLFSNFLFFFFSNSHDRFLFLIPLWYPLEVNERCMKV